MADTKDIDISLTDIPDAVTAQYLSDLMNQEPERPIPEVPVEREKAFVFRTRAHTTDNPVIRIPGITTKQSIDEKLGTKWEKVYQRKHGDKAEYYEELADAVGSKFIRFTRIGPGKGAVYQTDQPIVADYLRGVIAKKMVAGLYEDYSQSAPLRSRFSDQTFPNTEQGREELARYDLAIEKAVDDRAKQSSTSKASAVVSAPAAKATSKAAAK